MSEDKTNTYEGMFLFPQAQTANLAEAVDHIKGLLERSDASLISLAKWDERRLAYEIKGNKRGVYLTAFFKAPPQNLTKLERDCNLSEKLLRAMVIRADQVPAEFIEASDGQASLADEIKARGEAAETATPSP